MSLEFGAGGGQGNIPLLLRSCLTAPWEVAFVTSRVWSIEEQNTECRNTLTSVGGREEQSGVSAAQTMNLGTDLDLTTEMSSASQDGRPWWRITLEHGVHTSTEYGRTLSPVYTHMYKMHIYAHTYIQTLLGIFS